MQTAAERDLPIALFRVSETHFECKGHSHES